MKLLSQVKQLGITSAIIGTDTAKDKTIVDAAGRNAEGMYSIFFSEPNDYVGYRTAFKQANGHDPASLSDYSYDGLEALAKAMTEANSLDATAVKNQLYRTTHYGASGVVKFDSNGEVVDKPMTIYKVVNGNFESQG